MSTSVVAASATWIVVFARASLPASSAIAAAERVIRPVLEKNLRRARLNEGMKSADMAGILFLAWKRSVFRCRGRFRHLWAGWIAPQKVPAGWFGNLFAVRASSRF